MTKSTLLKTSCGEKERYNYSGINLFKDKEIKVKLFFVQNFCVTWFVVVSSEKRTDSAFEMISISLVKIFY